MIISKLNAEGLDKAPVIEYGSPLVGTTSGPTKLNMVINVPEAQVGVEDFLPGEEMHWAFFYNEVHLILEGKAEVTYTLPANPNKVFKAVVEKGDTCLIVCGTRATWKVISKETFRHYFVIMHRYHFEKWQRNAVKEEK